MVFIAETGRQRRLVPFHSSQPVGIYRFRIFIVWTARIYGREINFLLGRIGIDKRAVSQYRTQHRRIHRDKIHQIGYMKYSIASCNTLDQF